MEPYDPRQRRGVSLVVKKLLCKVLRFCRGHLLTFQYSKDFFAQAHDEVIFIVRVMEVLKIELQLA
jgi:hypothetical protein